jgi:hypothetical protein
MGATEIGVTCPNCGISVQPEDVICFRCGENLSLLPTRNSRKLADVAFPGLPVIGYGPAMSAPSSHLPADQHKVPDTELDAADFDGLAVRGASIRGDAHRLHSVTRKDPVTGGSDGTVRFWDVPNLRETDRLILPGPVQTVAPAGDDHIAVLCCGEVIVYARHQPRQPATNPEGTAQ